MWGRDDKGEKPMVIWFNLVSGPDDPWSGVVMGLTRQLHKQASGARFDAPFALALTFYAPSRFYQPNWSGVRLDRWSRRHRVLEAQAALPSGLPADPVATVIALAEQAVDAAVAFAGKKQRVTDLPEMRSALRRLAEAGPAPVHDPEAPLRQVEGDEGREGRLVRVASSSGDDESEPTVGYLESHLRRVLDGTEAWVQVDRIAQGLSGNLRLSRFGEQLQLERHDHPGAPLRMARTRDLDRAIGVTIAWVQWPEELPIEITWQQVD